MTIFIQLPINHIMHKTLIIRAFKKAKAKRKKQGEKAPSLSHISEDIALFVKESEGLGLDEKTYRGYRNEAEKLIDTPEDISIKQLKVINGLSKFLGYDGYEDFVKNLEGKNFAQTFVSFLKRNKVVLIIIFLLLVGVSIYYFANQQCYMVWKKDHYVEVKFDPQKYSLRQLKLCNEDRIENFKKITPNCETTVFFDSQGNVKIWYGKNSQKELEYFTSYGLHPDTGKTLKPITEYIIIKYVCKDFKEVMP